MKEEFDRIWRWAMKYMYNTEGEFRGYFSWSCDLDGNKNDKGPAPDGEIFFAMALFFASHRWGDSEGIFNYSEHARNILWDCVHKGEKPGDGNSLWNHERKLIKYGPYTTVIFLPSFNLPHFFELFSMWAIECDREFWKQATQASRDYLKLACHPRTGLSPYHAKFDGTPYYGTERHFFTNECYRVAANIGLSYEWFAKDEWECECADRIQKFFYETIKEKYTWAYDVDGTPIEGEAKNYVSLIATNAMTSLAAKGKYKEYAVRKFWDTPLATGGTRYFDNFMYLFAFMALSGNYRIY